MAGVSGEMGQVELGRPRVAGLERRRPVLLSHGFRATAAGQGLEWRFRAGALRGMRWLAADFLLRGDEQATFRLELSDGEHGPAFFLTFSMLPEMEARLRLPLARLDLNEWGLWREGALLKRCCYGERVDLARVDRARLRVERMAEAPVCWEMGALYASARAPARLKQGRLPKGPLCDVLGQSLHRRWAGRTADAAELVARLRTQRAQAAAAAWPGEFSRWGGWTRKRFAATGFFRVVKDRARWWLADPDGHAYWSAAMDSVRMGTPAAIDGVAHAIADAPRLFREFPTCRQARGGPHGRPTEFDFVRANWLRAFPEAEAHAAWADATIGLLRAAGFNGFGNWSDSAAASARGFPYVHPLRGAFSGTPRVFRDFPDVWHPAWPAEARAYAAQLEPLRGDPACIGYFLMNEPAWGFAEQTPAEGMLLNAPACPARAALAAYLQERYRTPAAIARAWGVPVDFRRIAEGSPFRRIPPGAKSDLTAFSTVMAAKLFGDLSAACRRVDPDHLNLGIRTYIPPPDWLVPAVGVFDVYSLNCYQHRIPVRRLAALSARLGRPVLIGEFHFGALDAGLPMAGICRVAGQADRGRAYRAYLEHAAAQPWCVGAHYFQLYDQPCLGRFDGENWNIGLLDICNRVYPEFHDAARAAHARLYAVAAGRARPYSGRPAYRPRHFC